MNRYNHTMLVVTAQLQLKTFDIASLYNCYNCKSSFVSYYGTHHTWLRVLSLTSNVELYRILKAGLICHISLSL